MMRRPWCALALSVCLVTVLEAQPPADFTGRWTVAAAPVPSGAAAQAATLRGDAGGGWGSTFVMTQDAARMVVESVVFSAYDLQPQPKFVYALDGSETHQAVMMGRGLQEQTSRAGWDAGSLRITTVHRAVDPATGKPFTIDVTRQLTLESPTSLVIDTTRGAPPGGVPTTTRTVYTKQ
jgi:hypothetical protein